MSKQFIHKIYKSNRYLLLMSSFLFFSCSSNENGELKEEEKITNSDIVIMSKLLIVLKLIEDGNLDQQDGAVRVGKLLKELYLDSAVKRADALDKEHEDDKVPINDGKNISWTNFKLMK